MKQRLIGAAVLISLIVIFVPMLLRGPVENRVVEVPVEIPPKPFQVVGKKKPDQSAEKIIHSIPEQTSRKPVLVEEDERNTSKIAGNKTTVAAEKPIKMVGDKEAKPTVKTELIKESKKNIVELAWVVQVGSFSSSKNALALRDKLRVKGYRTFVESINATSGKMYRVRVGPELDKSKIETAQKKLKQKENLAGQIIKHGQ